MVEILQNKSAATRFQILVEIAARGPNVQQRVIITDLAHLLDYEIDMNTIIIIGSSTTLPSTIGW